MVDYCSKDYVCKACGASGRKLWREYQTFLDRQTLLCANCVSKEYSKENRGKTVKFDDDGSRESEHVGPTDQAGSRVPAVPTKEGDTFWGYTSVPRDRYDWWRQLPTYPK